MGKASGRQPGRQRILIFTDTLGIYRGGLTFHSLRHSFGMIGGESRDQVAVNATIGYFGSTMANGFWKIGSSTLYRVEIALGFGSPRTGSAPNSGS